MSLSARAVCCTHSQTVRWRSVVAEFETALRAERQREGIAAAKKRGVYTGGKTRIDRTKVLDALKSMTPTAAAKALKVSRATIYRIAAE